MKKLKINIYYHEDIDGIFSALLIAKTYLDQGVNCAFTFQSVNYHLQDTWQTNPLCKDFDVNIVVDFLYHPDADLWYDHHESGWGKIEPHLNFKGCYDNKAPSCASVIFNDLNRPRFKDEPFIEKLLKGIDIVDQALYSNPEHPYSLRDWYTALRLSFMFNADTHYQQELIKVFLYNDLAFKRLKNNVIPEIAEWRALKALDTLEKDYASFKEVAQYQDHIVHFTIPPYKKFDRYFPFRFYKEALYTIYVRDNSWRGEGCFISVSKNPFYLQDSNVNIKELCERYGGGGHPAVGGCTVKTLEEANTIKNELFELLSGSAKQFMSISNS